MADKIKELRDRKNQIVTEARSVLEGIAPDATEEVRTAEEGRFDTMIADADRIDGEIRRYESLIAQEAAVEAVAETRAGREDTSVDQAREEGMSEERAFGEWMRNGVADMSPEARSVMRKLHTRAMGTGESGTPTGNTGGFVIPPSFRAKLEEAKKAFGGIRPIATVFHTESGQSIEMPTFDDTANEGVILPENQAGAETHVVFGAENMGTFMYHSGIIKVPVQLLEDAFFSLDGFLPSRLVKRIARKENKDYATGNGTSAPKGFLTGINTVETAASGVIAWEDLIELMHAIDPEHRATSAFALSDDALKVIRKMKDAEGRPIWQESTRVGEPSTILGKPYAIVQEMPAVAASATPIAYGNFKSYMIRDAGTPIMQRLIERYAEALQVGFHAAERHGGFLLDAGDNPIKALSIKA